MYYPIECIFGKGPKSYRLESIRKGPEFEVKYLQIVWFGFLAETPAFTLSIG